MAFHSFTEEIHLYWVKVKLQIFAFTVKIVQIAEGFVVDLVLLGAALFHFMMISSLRMGITFPQNWPICPI